MEPFTQADPRAVDGMSASFHQHLLETLADLTSQLEQLTVDETNISTGSDQTDYFGNRFLEVLDSYNYAMVGLNTFLNRLDAEEAALSAELAGVEGQRDILLLERDSLIEKGHELNCRMAYNALVRKLDDSFTSLEKNTSEESARCFKDDAEERLKRSHELIRVASMTSCSIDRDTFKEMTSAYSRPFLPTGLRRHGSHNPDSLAFIARAINRVHHFARGGNQMEKITNLFENYERDRDLYVKELDLYSDVRRQKISSWLAEPRPDDETEIGETVLDYLNLTQRQRHMEVQVIKNALRMYSFNASLNFDREDNLRLMEELTSLQIKVNAMSGLTKILPRYAKAKTDLSHQEDDSSDEAEPSAGDSSREEKRGRGLHRCPRKVNLATDPITDPDIVAQLQDNLRWDDRDMVSVYGQTDSFSEHLDQPVTSSDSTTEAVLKAVDSICGDADVIKQQTDHYLEFAAVDEAKPSNTLSETKYKETPSHSTHSFLHHIESSTVLPGSAEKKIAGLVRKKQNVRPVGSLTSLNDNEKDVCNPKLNHREDREARSQGNDPAPRLVAGPNKSREYVQSTLCSSSEQRKATVGAIKDEEDEAVKVKEPKE